jgi:hypothetical protein
MDKKSLGKNWSKLPEDICAYICTLINNGSHHFMSHDHSKEHCLRRREIWKGSRVQKRLEGKFANFHIYEEEDSFSHKNIKPVPPKIPYLSGKFSPIL